MDPVLSETAPAQVAAEVKQQNGVATTMTKRHEEYQYLDLVQEILETGEHRPDRYYACLESATVRSLVQANTFQKEQEQEPIASLRHAPSSSRSTTTDRLSCRC